MGLELKDVILQTLAEMETTIQTSQKVAYEAKELPVEELCEESEQESDIHNIEESYYVPPLNYESSVVKSTPNSLGEKFFLENLRERMAVLFDGLQSGNLVDKEKKLDLTLNFLEYALALTDKRLNEL